MRRLLGLLLSLLVGAGSAAAQVVEPFRDEVPLADLLEIVILEHQLLAIDATAGDSSVELHLGERVHWKGTRGRVGLVLTDERVLAVATGSPAWRELRLLRGERLPAGAALGDRVALVLTSQRAIGFDAGAGRLAEYRLGPQESLRSSRVAENVGVVVTDRKALGLSSEAGGFFESTLQVREKIQGLDVRANLAMLRTDRRILTFRGPTGSWSERRLDLVDRGD
jgi:hypothetical protein